MLLKDIHYRLHKIGDEDADFQASDWTLTNPTYVGYIDFSGRWIIKKIDADTGSVRWAYGPSDYATAWLGKASLTYGYFYELGL